MTEVITSEWTDGEWRYFDSAGNRLEMLCYDDERQRMVAKPFVAVSPSTLAWIDMHDPENGDPCTVRGHIVDVCDRRLTVIEPNGTFWLWILEPATWEGIEGYYIGRWPD